VLIHNRDVACNVPTRDETPSLLIWIISGTVTTCSLVG